MYRFANGIVKTIAAAPAPLDRLRFSSRVLHFFFGVDEGFRSSQTGKGIS
jgi:hypothetical protein